MYFFFTFIWFTGLATGFPADRSGSSPVSKRTAESTLHTIQDRTLGTTLNGSSNAAHSNADYWIINCDDNETKLLKFAIAVARDDGFRGVLNAVEGVHSPAYRTMFKSNQYVNRIQAVWTAMLRHSPTARTGIAPSYTCIKPGDPNWGYCRSGSYIVTPSSVLPVVGVCSPAFNLPPGSPADYDRTKCPVVRNNEFASRPGAGEPFVASLAQLISDALLDKYAAISNIRDGTIIRKLNSAVARDIESSSLLATNYQMCIRLVLYKCTDFPDVTLPPFNFPPVGAAANPSPVFNFTLSNASSPDLSTSNSSLLSSSSNGDVATA